MQVRYRRNTDRTVLGTGVTLIHKRTLGGKALLFCFQWHICTFLSILAD